MTINIKAVKLDLTPAIKQYIEDKLGALDKFIVTWEKNGEANLIVEIARSTVHHHQGDVYYAVANLNLNGNVIRAEHTDEEIRAAIDKIKDTLKLEIQKFKDKHELDHQAIRDKKLAE